MRGHHCASAIFVTKKVVAAFNPKNREAQFGECGNQIGAGDTGESGSCGDGNSLDSNELQWVFRPALHLQAQLYRFANPLRDLVQRPSLRVACRDLRNGGDVVAFLIAFNNDIELAWQRMCPRFPF